MGIGQTSKRELEPRALMVAVALVAGCGLALQVTFTRVFSHMIWHHFTYLVIGVALLGSGAAGTFVSVQGWTPEMIRRRLWLVTAGFALAIVATLALIVAVRFDPLRGDQAIRTVFGLIVYFGALFTTFFLGGLAIVCAFRLNLVGSHRLYFADLLGAAAATLVSIFVIRAIGGPSTLLLLALLTVAAAWLLRPERRDSRSWALLGLGAVVLLLWVGSLLRPVPLPVPESKSLYWALRSANSREPEYTRWNPVARVDVTAPATIETPMIVGGVSQRWLEEQRAADPEAAPYELRFVTLDGTSMTGLYRFDGDLAPFEFLRHTIIAAPYVLAPENPSYLAIGVGGGLDILLARLHGAREVTAIDLNADVIRLLEGPYADYTGRLGDDPQTRLVAQEGRSFLMSDRGQYDVIQGIGLDNVVALSSGAYVLAESYLYTVEAVQRALEALTPEGVWAWTRNTSTPPSEMLRLAGIAAEALERMGIAEPARHMMMVGNEDVSTITLLVSHAVSAESAARLTDWAAGNGFPVLHHPLEPLETPFADYLFAADRRAFEAAYPLSIGPVYDDHPFYYNYYKFSNLRGNPEFSGTLSTRFPVGNLILLTLMACSLAGAFVFIVLPLLRFRRSGLHLPHARPLLTYFSALGMAFIFVEIVLIQRFTLFIGQPTLAATTTIASLLLASGFGSLLGQRLCTTPQRLRSALALLMALIALYAVALKPLLDGLLVLPDLARVLTAMLLIAPLGLLMGMPFPTGLNRLAQESPEIVPWAWGLNGVFSVLGSTLVIIVSMIWNFTAAFVFGALLYGVALWTARALWQRRTLTEHAPALGSAFSPLPLQEPLRD